MKGLLSFLKNLNFTFNQFTDSLPLNFHRMRIWVLSQIYGLPGPGKSQLYLSCKSPENPTKSRWGLISEIRELRAQVLVMLSEGE